MEEEKNHLFKQVNLNLGVQDLLGFLYAELC